MIKLLDQNVKSKCITDWFSDLPYDSGDPGRRSVMESAPGN